MPLAEETHGTTQDMLEGLCLLFNLGAPWVSHSRARGGAWGEGCLGISGKTVVTETQFQVKTAFTSMSNSYVDFCC